jgi:hypothetical protein
MNERIKELAEQSGFLYHVSVGLVAGPEASPHKFAELIVRMCADAADMYEGKTDYIGDCVAEYMGYGVEEGVAEWRAK